MYSKRGLQDGFRRIDDDHKGSLTGDELVRFFMEEAHCPWYCNERTIACLVDFADLNDDDEIGYLELSQVLECDSLVEFAALVPQKKAKAQEEKAEEKTDTDEKTEEKAEEQAEEQAAEQAAEQAEAEGKEESKAAIDATADAKEKKVEAAAKPVTKYMHSIHSCDELGPPVHRPPEAPCAHRCLLARTALPALQTK